MLAEEIFLAALERSQPRERQAYLDGACGGDAELRAHVEALLHSHQQAGSFLETPLFEPTTDGQPLEAAGAQIGPYKLLEQIGEGGFGVVFMAEQAEPVRRRVALKVIKPGMDTRQVIARFEAERQALAMMDHPNIAQVLDAGTTGAEMRNAERGMRNEEEQAASAAIPHSELRTPHSTPARPYFVMELVRGIPITRYCDEHRLSVRERLQLFITVCQAIQHAHTKGIIHRDIKPTNVLVTRLDGRPVVKVIDFGVAKAIGQPLTERTLFTAFAQVIGTPLYMSPEQAELSGADIDTRSDVYSLGVLLYELLTGTTPVKQEQLQQAAFDEIRRIIREDEPERPSSRISTLAAPSIAAQRHTDPQKLARLVRGELDWIVMKALEKDRGRRYETASGFATDVERYLDGEPVQACPPRVGYRFRKFAWRHKGWLTASSLIAAALVAGLVMSSWQAIRATKAERLAQRLLKGEQQQRALAQQNAADAFARRREAEAAHQEALANLRQACEAVDVLLTRVSEEKLLSTPQMELLRKSLLEDALQFYQRFLQQSGSDPAVRQAAGEAFRRTGQIYKQLGQPDRAEQADRKAIALLEKLAAELPADAAVRNALALSHSELGDALLRMGRYPESQAALRQAIDLVQKLTAEFPQDDGYARLLDRLQVDLEWVSERLFRVAEIHKSEEYYRENLATQEKLLANAPDDPLQQNRVAYAQMKLGRSLHLGRPADAERLYREALAANRKLTSEFPHTTQFRADLAEDCHHLFLLLRAARRYGEAEAAFRESLPHLEKVVADAPTLPYVRRLLVDHHWDLALLQEAAGRPQEAERLLQRAIAEAEKMCRDFPDYAWAPARLALIQNHVGTNHRQAGRLPEAEAAFRRALAVSEKGVQRFPQEELRCRLADSSLHLALLLERTQRPEEAAAIIHKLAETDATSATICNYAAWRLATDDDLEIRHPRWAVELAQRAVAAEPEAGSVWNTLGMAHYRAAQWLESLAALEKSLALRQGGSSFDWFFLAMVHWQLGHREEARRWYNQALAWMDEHDPVNEELVRFRAEAAELLGVTTTAKSSP